MCGAMIPPPIGIQIQAVIPKMLARQVQEEIRVSIQPERVLAKFLGSLNFMVAFGQAKVGVPMQPPPEQ
jgi:hypothetical protein